MPKSKRFPISRELLCEAPREIALVQEAPRPAAAAWLDEMRAVVARPQAATRSVARDEEPGDVLPAAWQAWLVRATDYDLTKLRAAIDRLLLDPRRLARIREHLRIGASVSYLSTARNRVRRGRVVDISEDRVLIQTADTRLRWLHYASVVLDGPKDDQGPTARTQPLCAGDRVSFEDRNQVHRFGVVVRVNAKTVTVECGGAKQRVPHAELMRVVDI